MKKTASDGRVLRVIDANANRLTEGLRVCEDTARFILNDKKATQSFNLCESLFVSSRGDPTDACDFFQLLLPIFGLRKFLKAKEFMNTRKHNSILNIKVSSKSLMMLL